MTESLDISKLLSLRKVTRAVAEHLTGQVQGYLTTLSPLIGARGVFGEYLRSANKQPSVNGQDEAFESLRELYQALAKSGVFNIPKTLESPVEFFNTPLEVFPFEYAYTPGGEGGEGGKTIVVTAPLRWTVAYSGFSLTRLRELASQQKKAAGNELQQFVLHYLILHVTLSRRPGALRLLSGLRFPHSTERLPEFGGLPIPCLTCPASTSRPDDEVIVQSTELSGAAAFEEIINLAEIADMTDPLKDQLAQIVKKQGVEPPSSVEPTSGTENHE